jgi:hypothetical protein
MKRYSPTGRRNHGRPLKRLLDTWDWKGSTSGPTPWQIDDDDDDVIYTTEIKQLRWFGGPLTENFTRAAVESAQNNGTGPLPKKTGSPGNVQRKILSTLKCGRQTFQTKEPSTLTQSARFLCSRETQFESQWQHKISSFLW